MITWVREIRTNKNKNRGHNVIVGTAEILLKTH